MLGLTHLAAKRLQLSASLEDYLEVIYNLASKTGQVRCKDIADRLGVARASVTGALRMLKDKGLANYEPYGTVTLTDAGADRAAEVAGKHDVLSTFFVHVLGVNPEAAGRAACRAEHALGADIIDRLLDWVEFVEKSREGGYDVIQEFQQYCAKRVSR